jgi:hypothetical protein
MNNERHDEQTNSDDNDDTQGENTQEGLEISTREKNGLTLKNAAWI